ncbi:adenine-specific DNA-methyltransferase [Pontibacter aydingkolensis]|uniref:site-specific DNA-methyltransferase (adenine-specific) n=1 Tax=Pontibacter aydingkolensis TaxID=1911536 RepID=A0ABS7CQV2_9BACT|nr:DNA methyltransferase [Pontibacter aydingkolensis]MBW7466226.1 helix-turn-helix domain-containing protein [Pontibacter aydingkolensis]
MIDEELVSIDDAAKILNITRQTVSKYIKDNKLNAVKLNKNYRIASADLESFINSGATNHPIEIPAKRKGRNCTLEYEGKVAETHVLATPAAGRLELVRNEIAVDYNNFYFGDNLKVLPLLLERYRGRVDLIYIDPPFGTGQNFADIDNDHAYSDKLVDKDFLEFIRVRLILLREFLSEQGSIYLHIDKKIGHYVKIIMDEVFGYKNFINDITRIKCNPKNFARNAYGNYSDMILFYAKNTEKVLWNDVKEPLSADKLKELFPKKHKIYGAYTTHPLHAPGETKDGDSGREWMGMMPPKGRHWRHSREELTKLEMQGLIEWSDKGNPRKMVFAKDHVGSKVQDVWEFKDKGMSFVTYPTQKNHDLLKRIILNSSNPNSIVMDCFSGSGGTLTVAAELKRKWIGIDQSEKSLEVVQSNLQSKKIPYNLYRFVASL